MCRALLGLLSICRSKRFQKMARQYCQVVMLSVSRLGYCLFREVLLSFFFLQRVFLMSPPLLGTPHGQQYQVVRLSVSLLDSYS